MKNTNMFLKVVSFVILLQVVAICGLPEKFMIKNKKTGFVLDGAELFVAAGPWANKDTQLWTSEASGTSGHYIIRNLGNQKALDACPVTKAILSWNRHGGTNQRWKLDTTGDTRLQVEYHRGDFLIQQDNKPVLHGSKQADDSDFWILVEPQIQAV